LDEKITANEWNKKKACPICRDIADKAIPLDGEVMTHPKTEKPLNCPMCGYAETRLFHLAVVESKRSSDRGDTQPWNHLLKVECMSCAWSHVVKNEVCLGDPHDEVFGFNRPMEQHAQQKHALTWSNEEAVGLRGVGKKYDKDAELFGKGHRAKRKIETQRKLDGNSHVEWKPSKEERKLPRFKGSKLE
jgi:hypothetical protein